MFHPKKQTQVPIKPYNSAQITIFAANLYFNKIRQFINSRKPSFSSSASHASKTEWLNKTIKEYLNDPKHYKERCIIQRTPYYMNGSYIPLVNKLRIS